MRRTRLLALTGAMLLDRPGSRRHAYEIARALDRQPGSVARILRSMVEAGWLVEQWEDEQTARRNSRPTRRYYTLTDDGTRELTAICRRAAASAADDDLVLTRFAADTGLNGRGTP